MNKEKNVQNTISRKDLPLVAEIRNKLEVQKADAILIAISLNGKCFEQMHMDALFTCIQKENLAIQKKIIFLIPDNALYAINLYRQENLHREDFYTEKLDKDAFKRLIEIYQGSQEKAKEADVQGKKWVNDKLFPVLEKFNLQDSVEFIYWRDLNQFTTAKDNTLERLEKLCDENLDPEKDQETITLRRKLQEGVTKYEERQDDQGDKKGISLCSLLYLFEESVKQADLRKCLQTEHKVSYVAELYPRGSNPVVQYFREKEKQEGFKINTHGVEYSSLNLKMEVKEDPPINVNTHAGIQKLQKQTAVITTATEKLTKKTDHITKTIDHLENEMRELKQQNAQLQTQNAQLVTMISEVFSLLKNMSGTSPPKFGQSPQILFGPTPITYKKEGANESITYEKSS